MGLISQKLNIWIFANTSDESEPTLLKPELELKDFRLVLFFSYYYIYSRRCVQYMRLMANLQWIELIIMFIFEITYPHENMGHLFLLLLIYFNYFSSHNLFNYIIDLMIYSYDKIINMKIIHSYENARIFDSNATIIHYLILWYFQVLSSYEKLLIKANLL